MQSLAETSPTTHICTHWSLESVLAGGNPKPRNRWGGRPHICVQSSDSVQSGDQPRAASAIAVASAPPAVIASQQNTIHSPTGPASPVANAAASS